MFKINKLPFVKHFSSVLLSVSNVLFPQKLRWKSNTFLYQQMTHFVHINTFYTVRFSIFEDSLFVFCFGFKFRERSQAWDNCAGRARPKLAHARRQNTRHKKRLKFVRARKRCKSDTFHGPSYTILRPREIWSYILFRQNLFNKVR